MAEDDENKVLRLADLKPLFGEKTDPETGAPPDATIEAPSEPTNLSQHIYDKLYPYFTELLNKAACRKATTLRG